MNLCYREVSHKIATTHSFSSLWNGMRRPNLGLGSSFDEPPLGRDQDQVDCSGAMFNQQCRQPANMDEGECENDVVIMLDKLDKMLDQSKCHGDDPIIHERLLEQHNLIRELGMKFKFSVYKGIVMEARNANLLNENEALQSVVNEEKERAIQIQKKVKHLEESAATFKKIKEEYEELTLSLKEGVMSLEQIHVEPEKPETAEKGTTCRDLFCTSDKDTQTWVPSGCAKCLSEEQQRYEMEAKLGPTVMLTQADLNRLDEDMQALKDSLKQRDKSWAKMEKRDKSQRARLCRLDSELMSMKETANNRKQEIENKTILIKSLEAQLKKEQREIAQLKRASRGRRKSVAKKRSSNKSKSPSPHRQPIVFTPAANHATEEEDELDLEYEKPSTISLVASMSSTTPSRTPSLTPLPSLTMTPLPLPTPTPTPTPKRMPTPSPTPKRTPTPSPTPKRRMATPSPSPNTKLKPTAGQMSMPTSGKATAPMLIATPKSCANTGLNNHTLTSESRPLRPPSVTRGGREILARPSTNDQRPRKKRNRSILTRTTHVDPGQRSLSINLNGEGRF